MKGWINNAVILSLVVLGLISFAFSQDQAGAAPSSAPLLLVQEIPLPHVEGRIDHFTFDAKRKRVIGAALGNNTVEVVDTFAGRDIHSIAGAADPQGVAFVGELNKLFVANGADEMLRGWDPEQMRDAAVGFHLILRRRAEPDIRPPVSPRSNAGTRVRQHVLDVLGALRQECPDEVRGLLNPVPEFVTPKRRYLVVERIAKARKDSLRYAQLGTPLVPL